MGNFSEYVVSRKDRRSRNLLDNTSFNIWARGSPLTSAGYTADRWIVGSSGVVAWSASKSATVPTGFSGASMRIEVTTPDASVTTTDHLHLKQHIEGSSLLPLVGRYGTVSFWVYSTLAGVYNFYVRNASDRSYVTTYTINQANTWEYKRITIPFNYSGGTWNYDHQLGLIVGWPLAMGATYVTGTTDEWVSGVYMGSADQCDFVGDTNVFYMTSPQLELGRIATSYQGLDPKQDQEICARYYEVNFVYKHGLSTGTGFGTVWSNMQYRTKKRTTPTSVTAALVGDNLDIYQAGVGWNVASSLVVNGYNDHQARYYMTDTVNSIYTSGNCNLIRCTFYISCDL